MAIGHGIRFHLNFYVSVVFIWYNIVFTVQHQLLTCQNPCVENNRFAQQIPQIAKWHKDRREQLGPKYLLFLYATFVVNKPTCSNFLKDG